MGDMSCIKTPCYIIDESAFERNLNTINSAFRAVWGDNLLIGYSIKTNHFPWFLKKARQMNCWAEAVSAVEVNHALRHGYTSDKIIFNGPQKDVDTTIGVLRGGGIVNIDNLQEAEILCSHATEITGDARIGLRVNFNLESICPGETTAGNDVSRFGLCVENEEFGIAVNLLRSHGFTISGLHLHYSSLTRSTRIFRALAEKACNLVKDYSLSSGLNYIDIGGGFFGGQINPNYPSMEEYASVITNTLAKAISPKDTLLILEPGASILSTSVEYCSRVLNKRVVRDTHVITMDGTQLHINPFMVKRDLCIRWIGTSQQKLVNKQLICGCTCMENDRFVVLFDHPQINVDDYMIVSFAGAYTMSFNSCFINLPPNVYIRTKDSYDILRLTLDFLASLN